MLEEQFNEKHLSVTRKINAKKKGVC